MHHHTTRGQTANAVRPDSRLWGMWALASHAGVPASVEKLLLKDRVGTECSAVATELVD
jgi:hypothetical protein